MSTRDMILEVSDAYKKKNGEYLGHNLPLLAEHSGTDTRIFGDIMPNCGPLLIINENQQRWVATGYVRFTYNIAEFSGYITETVNNISYQQAVYTGVVGEYTGTVYFESGMREYSQQIYNDHQHIRKINSMYVSDPLQEIKVFCIADDGARLFYGMHDELIRDLNEIVEQGLFISPPKCQLCNGSGLYEGSTCIDCSGYKYIGRNAQKWLLEERCKDVGIYKRTEIEDSFQYRGWAKKWWLVPTQKEVIRYMSHFLNTPSGNIVIVENYFPEAYWKIQFPRVSLGSFGVGNLLSLSGTTYQELIDDVTPAGTQAVLEGYYLFQDSGAIHDYCHDPSDPPHLTGLTPEFGFIFPQVPIDSFDTDDYWYDETKYFNADSGIIYIAGTGSWSGSSLITDSGYWSGIDADFHEQIINYDIPFTGVIV